MYPESLQVNLTSPVATSTSILTVVAVVISCKSAINQSALIPNTAHIIQEDWAISLTKLCCLIGNGIFNKKRT